jgi:hypothetical protein
MIPAADIISELQAARRPGGEWRPGGSDTADRQRECYRKLSVDGERHLELIQIRIQELMNTPYMRRELIKYAPSGMPHNALRRMADVVSVPYHRPPRRRVRSGSASESLGRLYQTSGLNRSLRLAARYSFLCGVTLLFPHTGAHRPSGAPPRMSCEVFAGDVLEAVWHLSDPEHPDAALIKYVDADRPQFAPDRAAYKLIAGDGVVLLDSQCRPIPGRAIEAPLGPAPLVCVRVRDNQPGDWWDWRANSRLLHTTLDVAVVAALMDYTRKAQSRKLVTMIGDIEGIPDEQAASTEHPLVVESASPGRTEIKVLDLNTPVKDFRDHIAFKLEALAESYGLPSSVLDKRSTVMDAAANGPEIHEALSKLRDSQIEPLTSSERHLAALVARRSSPVGLKFPNERQILDGFTIDWQPLSYVDQPLQRLKVQQEKIKLGISSQVQAYMEEHPECSEDEALEEVKRLIEQRNEIDDLLAARNLAADPYQQHNNAARAQGREGGLANNTEDEQSDD